MAGVGRFPHAVKHEALTNGIPSAIKLSQMICRGTMTNAEAAEYVRRCVVTNGQPHLIDLYEQAEEKVDA